MSRERKTLLILSVTVVTGFVVWAVYATFIGGTTRGPDFVQAVKSGGVSASSVSSIEVVEPALGHTPFTAEEYGNLPRRTIIADGSSINRLLTLLRSSQRGRIHQKHPATTYQAYLKINCQDGFFWLYVDVLQDAEGAILSLSANSRNAVNPNGASTYHLDEVSDILSILQNDKRTEQDDAREWPIAADSSG
jgi:hypothetical protein